MALVFYCQRTTSADTYGGSSATVLASGSGTATTSGTTCTVSGAADLTTLGITNNVDTIRIATETAGLNSTDVFLITAHSATTITVGVTFDGVSSQDWCIGGPWEKLQRPMDVVSAGDKVWVKADGLYTDDNGSSRHFENKQNGTTGAPIVFEGYKTTTGDIEDYYKANPAIRPSNSIYDYSSGTYCRPVIDAADSLARCLYTGAAGNHYYVFKHLHFKRATAIAVDSPGHAITWKNCRFDNSPIGLSVSTGLTEVAEGCSFTDCTNTALVAGIMMGVYNCDFGGNVIAVTAGNGVIVLYSTIHENTGDGINCTTTSNYRINVIVNNTIVGNNKESGKAAIRLKDDLQSVIANNIIHNWATGIEGETDQLENLCVRNNLLADNTADRSNFPAGGGDITACTDPLFVDEANGDLRLWPVSLAKIAGLPGDIDIGAYQNDFTHPKKGGAWQYIDP